MDKSPMACEDEDDLDLHRAHKQNCTFSQRHIQVLLRFITDMKLCLMSLKRVHVHTHFEATFKNIEAKMINCS